MPVWKFASGVVVLFAAVALLAAPLLMRRVSKNGDKPAFPAVAPHQLYLVYQGASDASAAVALDEMTFALADDEDNLLRIFRSDAPGPPVSSLELGEFLKPDPVELEADIEGAAKLGDRIYWLTSHDTNKRGEPKPGRDYFFATDISRQGNTWKLTPAGAPSRILLTSLVESPGFQELRRVIAPSAPKRNSGKKKQNLPAEAVTGPIAFEGLCASPDGKRLFIGFRQPRLLGQEDRVARALVVALENPAEVVEGRAAPVFGEPLALNLGGMVIRGMEYSPAHKSVFIIAGPEKKGFSFVLYRWDAQPSSQPVPVGPLAPEEHQVTPEALVAFPTGKLFVICDDGDVVVDTAGGAPAGFGKARAVRNKELPDSNLKQFRALWFNLADAPAASNGQGRGVAP